MGGIFGTISKKSCVADLFYGTDYNSHLGTRRGGLATYSSEKGFVRSIHNLESSYFRTKFEPTLNKFEGATSGIGVISDTDAQPLIMNSHLGRFAICTVAKIVNKDELTQYLLDKNTVLTLLLGYDPVARMKVVKRWQELEAQAAPAVPQTMAQALRLAADQAEQLDAQREQLALQEPKVQYVDRYVAANGSLGFRQVAKLLQANEHEFRTWLQDAKIMYRLGNEWTAYQNHIEAGRFVVRAGVATANEHAFNTTKFTPKGVEWVAGLWGKHKARQAQEAGVQA